MDKTVLIVDDSRTMRKIVARSLRQAGLEFAGVLEASDGEEALQVLNVQRADLVLCDLNMPNMDGIDFLRQKAANGRIKDIPVVMITAEAGPDFLLEVKGLGASGVIKKPFTPEQINQAVSALL